MGGTRCMIHGSSTAARMTTRSKCTVMVWSMDAQDGKTNLEIQATDLNTDTVSQASCTTRSGMVERDVITCVKSSVSRRMKHSDSPTHTVRGSDIGDSTELQSATVFVRSL